jgi:hypothetical protein
VASCFCSRAITEPSLTYLCNTTMVICVANGNGVTPVQKILSLCSTVTGMNPATVPVRNLNDARTVINFN